MPITNQLVQTSQELNQSLQALKPNNSETTQLITYTLIGAALVGIFVYHYIKEQEEPPQGIKRC
jgi:hypothetical protein